jgi:hypothetical protein
MFETATEESIILRPETLFYYMCSIYFLVSAELAGMALIYIFVGIALFVFETDDDEMELENSGIKAFREE